MVSNLGNLKYLYKEMLLDVSEFDDIYTFFMQVGKNYYSADNKILFVGKATNGWISNDKNVEQLFNPYNKNRIVNRDDQLEWVEKMAGDEKYNTNKSAFWRLIKSISKEINKETDWYNYIAWSNLYKISHDEGNPSEKLQKFQRSHCVKILDEEIKLLNPDIVIFLTSGWEDFYVKKLYLNPMTEISWGNNYNVKYQVKDNILYILSVHPQGKEETAHKKAIIEIIKPTQ